MELKFLEIRDRDTCIPALVIRMTDDGDPVARQFLHRYGYPLVDAAGRGHPSIVLMRLEDQRTTSDAYEWRDRTHQAAHVYLDAHFDELTSGQVLDVRVIVGEAIEPAAPEIMP